MTRIARQRGKGALVAVGLVVTLVASSVACSSGSGQRGTSHSASPIAASTHASSSSSSTATAAAPSEARVASTVTLSASATYLRYALGSVWAVTQSGAVLRLTTAGKQVAEPVRTGALDVKFDHGRMYVLTATSVQQLDPSTGHLDLRRTIANGVSFDVFNGVAFVATGGPRSAVESIDLATGHSRSYVLSDQLANAEQADSIAVAGGAVWVIAGTTLVELSAASLAIQGRFPLPIAATTLRATAAGVFVASQNPGGGIVRLAPGASAVSACWDSGDALQLAPQGADLWVSAAAGLTELDQRTCAVLGQAAPPDQTATGVALLPHQVWCSFPDVEKIQIVDLP